MPLVTSEKMLLDAQKGGYAVGAFNAENLEMAQAIVAAAEELRAPVMIQTTSSTLKYASPKIYRDMVAAIAESSSAPVCMHLDHGDSVETCMRALRAGYTSLMIDGSHMPYEQNVAEVSVVARAGRACGVPVEAELGKVGGKEDDLDGGNGGYTVPEEALDFVNRTGVTSLAVAIGTAHGVYKGVPKLDIERLKAIRKLVEIPLVLHGASGLSDQAVRDCIAEGICKVNFATELRIAYTDAVRAFLSADAKAFDPKKYGAPGREAVKRLVMERMRVCGCDGKA